jgi:hypothetical protein
MSDEETSVVLINMEGIEEKAQQGFIDALNSGAVDFAARLAEELPPGVNASQIIIKPAKSGSDTYTVSVGIEDEGVLKWLWGYWKGESAVVDIFGNMSFQRWKNPHSEPDKNGYYHFKHVRHEYLPHDFVEKALEKFDTLGDKIISKMRERLGQ